MKNQTFNSGTVKIYSVENIAAQGDKSSAALVLKETLRYKERTVGLNRYYAALQANINVNYLLRCCIVRSVSTQDIAIPNDGKQYRIIQIQYPEDEIPPVMDITLEEVVQKHEIPEV